MNLSQRIAYYWTLFFLRGGKVQLRRHGRRHVISGVPSMRWKWVQFFADVRQRRDGTKYIQVR